MSSWLDRIIALTTVAVAVALVWTLLHVHPDARGFGTHEQLGMTPCSWPASYGAPCPTCGVTTAAAALVHLRPLQALGIQPFGAILAGTGLFAAGFALFCLLRGRSFLDGLTWLPYGRILLVGVLLLLGSWLYKYLTFTT